METSDNSIELQIASVLSDIRQKGYSSMQPFSIGKVEERMMLFAQITGVTLASDDLYMIAKQLQYSMRASKEAKGLVVEDADTTLGYFFVLNYLLQLLHWLCSQYQE